MVDKTGNPTLASSVNYVFFVYPEEITCTLVLQLLSRVIFLLSSVCHAQPHYLPYILNYLPRKQLL